jgi:hypothetical protein
MGKCQTGHGNPSGHTLFAFLFTLTLFFDFIRHWKNLFAKSVTFLAFNICLPSTIAYSRLYMGVHSLNQVIFGGLIGIWLAVVLHTMVKKPFMRHLESLWTANSETKSKSILKICAFVVLIISLETLGFLYRNNNRDTTFMTKLVEQRPSCKVIDWDEKLHFKNYIGSYSLLHFFGAYVGFSKFGVNWVTNHDLRDQASGISNTMKRMILIFLLFIPYTIFRKIEFHFLKDSMARVFLDVTVQAALPCFLLGFTLFSLGPFLYFNLEMIDQQEIGGQDFKSFKDEEAKEEGEEIEMAQMAQM